jgi:hypothetical protein
MDSDDLDAIALSLRLQDVKRARASALRKSHDDHRKPTEVFDDYWLWAKRRGKASGAKDTERSGKWLLFIKVAESTNGGLRSKRPPRAAY